ncbi:MAG: helix-turn-helix domain-containing protein [Deltaproteobacteria bacterium]|nr:helix-turn-helix domain-containing protein [Deltaproteobacteria bacterium]
MLVSVSQAARELNLSIDHLRRWIRAGKIPIYKLGPRSTRVDLDELKSLGRLRAEAEQDQAGDLLDESEAR